ncbi:MAG: methyltransferase domain-containing protein [Rhodospirillales bacterium]|nr:methyltransferase domain-containing protein [Rhodospirillales bacterium]
MSAPMFVFDRRAVRHHRDRAAGSLNAHDFLFHEVGKRLDDRLNDVRRTFADVLDLGCHHGGLSQFLLARDGVRTLVQCDLSQAMVHHAPGLRVAADEEALPFAAQSFDLVASVLSLHWVNDLPGTLIQLRHALRPDGLLLAAILGGDTLKELRSALAEAELALEGGISPRVSPFAEVRDIGNLLQRAGFALPVVDVDAITVSYADPLRLLADLRGMGETNAVRERRKSASRRATLFEALDRYRRDWADADGRIPATFQVIFLTAWAPDASQPRPLRRGSATTPLADALGVTEISPDGPARS